MNVKVVQLFTVELDYTVYVVFQTSLMLRRQVFQTSLMLIEKTSLSN